MARKLEGKVAVVTGASKGIGAEIARQFGDAGANVVVNYASDKAGAERVVKAIEGAGGKAVAVQANLAQPADVQRLFDEAHKAFGRLDVLVNNAGVYDLRPLEEVDAEHFHRQFDLNVLGLLLSAKEAAKRFGKGGGSIINIGSIAARSPLPGASVYCATKAAVDSITHALSMELGPRGIRVNSLNPGMVDTEGVRSAGIDKSDFRTKVEADTPLARIGQPGDIAPVAVFLASDDARWVTGEKLFVGGGLR